jgi:hypothetical protein
LVSQEILTKNAAFSQETYTRKLKNRKIQKTLVVYMDKRFLSCLMILLILLVLAPLITYSALTNNYNASIDSYRNKERNLQQQIDSLTEQNRQLTEENSQLTNLTQPHLVSKLGWFLHRSNDPVASSKNTFTIYGTISNLGFFPANNTELTIKFYDSKFALVQTSNIHLGVIQSITNSTAPFSVGTHNIDCSAADTVLDIVVSLNYQ